MYLVIIAWMYVAVMMAVAEATASNGTVLGAIFTFLLDGVLPAGLLAYILGTPARKARLRQQEIDAASAANEARVAERSTAPAAKPDASGHTPGATQD